MQAKQYVTACQNMLIYASNSIFCHPKTRNHECDNNKTKKTKKKKKWGKIIARECSKIPEKLRLGP